jgi:hypothetical protein
MDSEHPFDRFPALSPAPSPAPSPGPSAATFDRDRLLDLVSDLERDVSIVETAMEDIEQDNYDSVDAALVALAGRPTAPSP